LVPYQAFKAADGWILIGVTNDGAWKRFCAAVNLNEMGDNPDYATARGRIGHRDAIVAKIQALVGGQTVADLVKVLEPARIPVSPINTVRDVLENEQVKAIGATVPIAGLEGSTARVVGRPVSFATPYEELVRPAPGLGQHNLEILRDLGLTPEEVQELGARGAF
jgi:formyl-CoA transferase